APRHTARAQSSQTFSRGRAARLGYPSRVSQPKPPPPPPPRRPPPPRPTAAPASMSDSDKQALAFRALGLLEEQVQARIVHYKAELETSPELDAVTAQVVAQLKAMQSALGTDDAARLPPDQMEQKQIATLTKLLER